MPMSTMVSDTPYYVLMDGDRRIGPEVLQLDSGIECSAIYGFSGKGTYDRFCTNRQQALKPYPLVRGYLRSEVAASGDGLKLVVGDAAGPSEPYLFAATMEDVLESQEKRATGVTAAYRLAFDQEAGAYRVVNSQD